MLVFEFDNRDKIQPLIDNLRNLFTKFDEICRSDIASENRLLVIFEIFFADFKDLDDTVIADLAVDIGNIVEDKSVVVIVLLTQCLSFSLNGTNTFSSNKNFTNLYASYLIALL